MNNATQSHSPNDAQTTPSAWDYALATSSAYSGSAMCATFLVLWLGLGLSVADLGFLGSLLVATVLFFVSLFCLIGFLPIVLMMWLLAWLAGCGMTIEDRRQLIAEHQAADQHKLQILLANPPKRRRKNNDSVLTAFIFGALLGWWWHDD